MFFPSPKMFSGKNTYSFNRITSYFSFNSTIHKSFKSPFSKQFPTILQPIYAKSSLPPKDTGAVSINVFAAPLLFNTADILPVIIHARSDSGILRLQFHIRLNVTPVPDQILPVHSFRYTRPLIQNSPEVPAN